MNTKKYQKKSWLFAQVAFLATLAVLLVPIAHAHGLLVAGLLAAAGTACMARLEPRLCAVTLSVPELLMDVLDAFKVQTPELFEADGGFSKDFSSKTAVLNDVITAKIEHVPVVGDYNRANGGFKAATQDVTTLIEDVPVTLSQFKIVTVNINWLTQLSSKLPLYQRAISNYGFALGKFVVDYALQQCTAANFTNKVQVALNNVSLDTIDGEVRNQLNAQKAYGQNRYALVNSDFAKAFGSDDRVRSSLFYGMLNGANGYRVWRNIGGFAWVREYPDMFAGGNLLGFAADPRAICVASRRPDFANIADEIGVPTVMEFHQIQDDDSGLYMTGASWQEQGTGDVYVSCGILFGVGAGAQGGAAGVMTDNAGCRITKP